MTTASWDEIRTAYHVARLGTVSAAAEVLGVHHATVIRHVDALEARLGVRLFQRHARGYTPTEAGQDLLKVGQATDAQFSQLVSRIRGGGPEIAGELVVTTVSGIAGQLMPMIAAFSAAHPALTLRFLSDPRVFRLEHGEAHVAIRAGEKPKEADYVVQPFLRLTPHMAATAAYVARHGQPRADDLARHRFVGHAADTFGAPCHRWLRHAVPESAVAFQATDPAALEEAVLAGIGVGFVSARTLARHPELVEVMAPLPEWQARLWLVTHVDLHRTAKVQSLLAFLKAACKAEAE